MKGPTHSFHCLQDGEEFTRTACYHYFHLTCLASFVEFFNTQQLLLEEEEEQPLTATSRSKKPKQV